MSKRQRRRVATRRATHMRRAGQKLPVALAVVAAPAVVPAAAEAAHHHAAISMGSSAPHLISHALTAHPLAASPHPYAARAGQARFSALSHGDALTRAEVRFRAERTLQANALRIVRHRTHSVPLQSTRTASLPSWARGLPHARRFQVATSPGLQSDSSGSRSGESALGSAGAALDPAPAAAESSPSQRSGAEGSNPATPPISANPFPQVSSVIPAPAPPPGPPEEFGAALYTPGGGGGLTAVHSSDGQNYLKGALGIGEDASVTWGAGPSIEAPTQELKLEASAQISKVLSVEATVPLTGGEPGASPEVKAVVNLPVPEGTPGQSIGFSWSPQTGLQRAGEIEAPIDPTVEVPVSWKVDVSGVVQLPQLPDLPALLESTAREIVPNNSSPQDQSSPTPDERGIPVGNGIPVMDGSGAFVTVGTPGDVTGPRNSDQQQGGGLDLSNTGSLGNLQLDAGTQTDSPSNAATQSDSPSSAGPQTDSPSSGSNQQLDPNTWQPISSLQPVVTQTDAGTLTQSNPDGTIVQQNPAGVLTLTNPDGTSVCYDSCTGTVTTVNGQGTTAFQPDGSIRQVNNGQTTVWDSSGSGYLIDPVTGAPTSTATPPPAAPSIPDPIAPVPGGGGGSTPDQTVTPAPTDTSASAPTDTSAPAPTDTSAPAPTDTSAPAPTDTSAPAPSSSPDTSGGSSSSDSSSGGGDSSGGSSDSGGGGGGGGGAFTAG